MTAKKAKQKNFPEQIGEIINAAWDVFGKNFGLVASIALLASIGTIISTALVYQVDPDFDFSPFADASQLSDEVVGALFTGSVVEAVFQGLLYLVTVVAFIPIVKTGASLTLGEALRNTMKNIVPLFLISLVTGLIVIFGLILLIIPGIIFALWYSYTVYLTIDDRAPIRETLSRSKTLFKARPSLMVFWILVSIGISVALAIILVPVSFLVNQLPILGPVISAIANNLLFVFTVIGGVHVYFAARQILARNKGMKPNSKAS